MKWRFFLLFFLPHLLLVCDLQAGTWTALVEEIASRAAGGKARNAERVLVFREADEASRLLTKRMPSSVDDVAMLQRFERLQGTDGALRAEFKALSPVERQFVIELGEGAQRVYRLYPGDEGTRLLQHLDATGLAQSRTYGDFVLDGMAFVQSDEAIAAMRRPFSDETGRAISNTLGVAVTPDGLTEQQVAELWKSAVRKTGDGAGEFWRLYVAPHKGKWLGGGLLVAYLAMPERFHDAAGQLTEYGGREVGKLLGDSALGLGRGVLGGIGASIARRYAEAPITTGITLALIAFLLLLAIPRVRRLAWGMVFRTPSPRPIATVHHDSESKSLGSQLPSHPPLHE